MRKILQFLASEGAFLYEECSCNIVASQHIAAFGGTGSVTLSDGVVALRFWLDRDRMFVDFRGVSTQAHNTWFSMDVVKQMLTGEVTDKALVDHENTEYLKDNFHRIQDCFTTRNLTTTEMTCRRLERQRSKRLFG